MKMTFDLENNDIVRNFIRIRIKVQCLKHLELGELPLAVKRKQGMSLEERCLVQRNFSTENQT